MTDDNNKTAPADITAVREQAMKDKGAARSKKNRERLSLDQQPVILDIIGKSIPAVQDELRKQIHMAFTRGGGPTPMWLENFCRCDLNWSPDRINLGKGGKKQWNFNEPEDMDLRVVADLALRTVFDSIGRKSKFNAGLVHLGKAFEAHLFSVVLSETRDGQDFVERTARITQLETTDTMRRRDKAMYLAEKRGMYDKPWDASRHVYHGAILWNAVSAATEKVTKKLMKLDRKDDEEYFMVLSDEFAQELEERNIRLDRMSAMLAPMDKVPFDWGMDSIGPYDDVALAKMVPLVKNCRPTQEAVVNQSLRDGSMQKCIDALNLLQRTPYTINAYVLDAVRYVFDNELHRSVSSYPNLSKIGEKPFPDEDRWEAMEKEDRRSFMQENTEIRASDSDADANVINIQRWVEEADELTELTQFYLPHNFDTRGRVYHVTEFGHHNVDCLRGLFKFARRKPLGEHGALFIALQIANTYGVDKRSIDDRIEWSGSNEHAIIKAGEDFKSREAVTVKVFKDDKLVEVETTVFDFWASADDPCQFLAACHEWAEAKAFEQRNPGMGQDFPSGLPIALDASQSGVQHYAGATLNEADGRLVNLCPSTTAEKPSDLYLAVLAEAKRLMRERFNDPQFMGDPDNEKRIVAYQRLLSWDGYGRSVTKRNSMTYCYSSRQYGFAEQLRTDVMNELSKQLRLGEIDAHPFGEDRGWIDAFYIGELHEDAIENVVTSAADGMRFLQSCARALARENKHFHFVTKWGFPVHQEYEETRETRPKPWLFDFGSKDYLRADDSQRLCLQVPTGRVDSRESRQAISPNVIHAQDALHLMMTVALCHEQGINDLMVVHDSFSANPGDAMLMSQLVRQSFVDLYSEYDLFADIRDQVLAQLDNPDDADLEPLPDRGSLNLLGVLQSQYAFS